MYFCSKQIQCLLLSVLTLLNLGLLTLACSAQVDPESMATPRAEVSQDAQTTANSQTQIENGTEGMPIREEGDTRSGQVQGRVIDAETEQPVKGATIILGKEVRTSNAIGKFSFDGVTPGPYVLVAQEMGYETASTAVFPVEGEDTTELIIEMFPAGTFSHPEDPTTVNQVAPEGAKTKEDAVRLARLQGFAGSIDKAEERKLTGEFLVNYKSGNRFYSTRVYLDHEAWVIGSDGAEWYVIKSSGGLAVPIPSYSPVLMVPFAPTPMPTARPVPIRELTGEQAMVAFLSDRDHPYSSENWRQNQLELYIMSLGDANDQRITDGLGTNNLYSWLAWRPGSFEILMESYGSWTLVNARTGTFQKLEGQKTPDGQVGQRLGPDWSPEGELLVYVSAFVSDSLSWFNVSVSDLDGMGVRQVTPSYPQVVMYSPSWSPDGQNILFTQYNSSLTAEQQKALEEKGIDRSPTGVYIAPVEGGDIAQIMAWDTIRSISWSPDGTKIAFENRHDSGRFSHDIWVADSDGSNAKNLTELAEGQTAWSPRWSPDGTNIAFTLEDDKSSQVYIMNSDGTEMTQLTFNGNNCCPAWSR